MVTTKGERQMIFEGQDIGTQRIRIETENLNPMENILFVHVYHKHGDDTVTDVLFTPDEAQFLLSVLQQIYGK